MNRFSRGPARGPCSSTRNPGAHRILCLVLALALGGCGSTRPKGKDDRQAGLSPAEQQLRDDEKLYTQTVVGGAATGALVGALACGVLTGVTGGDKKNVERAALACGALGAVAGGLHGAKKGEKEREANQEQRQVQADLAAAQKDNQRLQALNKSSESVLGEARKRLARLKSDVAARRVSVQQAEQARQREQANIDSMERALAKAKTSRDQYQDAAKQLEASGDAEGKRNLDKEIERMNQQVSTLERSISSYNQALAVSRG